jgi:hypothetical protein
VIHTPARISDEVRSATILLWFEGYSLEDIAKKIGVHVGSVRNFIEELKRGDFPEYEGVLPYLDSMRHLAQEMRANKVSLQQTVIGSTAFTALTKLIDPQKLKQLLDLLLRIAPENFPKDKFVDAALRLAEIEKATGVSFTELPAKATEQRREIENLTATKSQLTKDIDSLRNSKKKEAEHLQHIMHEKRTTRELLERYEKDNQTFKAIGLRADDVTTFAELVRKARSEGWIAAAIELAQLEAQTGKNHSALLAEYKQAAAVVDKAKREYVQVSDETQKLRDEILTLKNARANELKLNNVTAKQLTQQASLSKRLAHFGIHFDDLEALSQLMLNLRKLGWDTGQIVAYLAGMNDLDAAKRAKEGELKNLNDAIAQARSILQTLNNEISATTEERTTLTNAVTRIRQTLGQLLTEESKKRKRIELADSLLLLLRDPAKLLVDKIADLVAELEIAMRALLSPEVHMFPLNFQPIRQKALMLWEIVLGKEFIPKELVDAELKKLGDLNTDLLMDRMHTLEHEKGRVRDERVEVERMTNAKALSLVVGWEKQRRAATYTCVACESTFAICLGSTACKEPESCPSCGARLPLREPRHFL